MLSYSSPEAANLNLMLAALPTVEEKTFQELKGLYIDQLEERTRKKLPVSRASPRDDSFFQKIVREDLDSMAKKIELDLHEPIWNILLVQSIHGHAQNGHGLFNAYQCKYPQATITDIIAAAGMDINSVKAERQKLIDEVYGWVNHAFNNDNDNNQLKRGKLQLNNLPLLRIKFIEDYAVNSVATLKGIVLAGYMDNYQARMDTIKHYQTTINGAPLEIGGGETYLVDLEMLAKAGLDQNFLAAVEHDDKKIDYLRRLGVIVDNSNNGESVYIRRKTGAGISDDLAMIMIGKKHGISAMLGAFVIDAIDTYDKCTLHPLRKGLDEALAEHIQQKWAEQKGTPLAGKEEILEIIYYSAKNNNPKVEASSSHRRFVQFAGEKLYRPTLQSHIAFVEGRPTEEFPVGYSRMSSSKLYEKAQKRINHMMEGK